MYLSDDALGPVGIKSILYEIVQNYHDDAQHNSSSIFI